MGGSTFVFIEAKTFKFAIEEGGRFSFYVFMREVGVHYVLSVWVRSALKDLCFMLRSCYLSQIRVNL